jgi:predicted CoA-binding protein
MAIVIPDDQTLKEILQTKKRIAVVGLSDKPERTSYQIAKYMLEHGYDIVPVNPTLESVFGIQAAASLREIGGHVDIVNVFRRPEFLLETAKDAVAIGADVYWAQLGLFDEKAYDFLRGHGMTVVMDRCIKVEHQRLLGE